MNETTKITDDMVVSIEYTLKDDSGEVLDSSDGGEPLSYLHGRGQIIPGLERELEGKIVGEGAEAVPELVRLLKEEAKVL